VRIGQGDEDHVRARRHQRARDLAAEDERQDRGQHDEQAQLDGAEVARQRPDRPAGETVRQRDRAQHQRDRRGKRADVGPRRPLEVQRSQQLAAQDDGQQRERAR
jgi:hypothetical protein